MICARKLRVRGAAEGGRRHRTWIRVLGGGQAEAHGRSKGGGEARSGGAHHERVIRPVFTPGFAYRCAVFPVCRPHPPRAEKPNHISVSGAHEGLRDAETSQSHANAVNPYKLSSFMRSCALRCRAHLLQLATGGKIQYSDGGGEGGSDVIVQRRGCAGGRDGDGDQSALLLERDFGQTLPCTHTQTHPHTREGTCGHTYTYHRHTYTHNRGADLGWAAGCR